MGAGESRTFKIRTVKWDKLRRIDRMFGSAGGVDISGVVETEAKAA